MGLGSVDDKYRRDFKKVAGKDWKADVTSRFKAQQLIKKLENEGLNSYLVRKLELLKEYDDSGTKLDLTRWLENGKEG